MYTYVGNDPINSVDPDGLLFKKLFGVFNKALKIVVIAGTAGAGSFASFLLFKVVAPALQVQ